MSFTNLRWPKQWKGWEKERLVGKQTRIDDFDDEQKIPEDKKPILPILEEI